MRCTLNLNLMLMLMLMRYWYCSLSLRERVGVRAPGLSTEAGGMRRAGR